VEGLFSKCNQELAQFVGLARCIWLRRNEVVCGEVFSHPNIIVQIIVWSIQEFTLAQGKGEQLTY
jgi:hypothetical protein